MNYRLLLSCGGAITALWLLRNLLSGESVWRYGFIPWNIFLAVVPLLLVPAFLYVRHRWSGAVRRGLQAFLAATWLLFLPNAFYVLTDFMHLNGNVLVNQRGDISVFVTPYGRGDGLFLFDAMLVLFAVLFSAYAGGLALVHAYNFFRKHVAAGWALSGLAAIALLSSVGVYIGRFARFNSWDGLTQPWSVVADLIDMLSVAAARERFLIIMLTMFIFQTAAFVLVRYTLAHWSNDDTADRR